MSTSELISMVAVVISFISLVSAFFFSYKKVDKEREKESEMNVQNITTIKKDISSISGDISEIKNKMDRLDQQNYSDHEKIIEHDGRIRNLEKSVFRKGD